MKTHFYYREPEYKSLPWQGHNLYQNNTRWYICRKCGQQFTTKNTKQTCLGVLIFRSWHDLGKWNETALKRLDTKTNWKKSGYKVPEGSVPDAYHMTADGQNVTALFVRNEAKTS